MGNVVDELIKEYDFQIARINIRNRDVPLEIKTLDFTVTLRHQTYEFTYVDKDSLLCRNTRTHEEKMVIIKKDFKKLLKHVSDTGYKLKCIRDNGSFIYLDFTKKSLFYKFATLIDRYVC